MLVQRGFSPLFDIRLYTYRIFIMLFRGHLLPNTPDMAHEVLNDSLESFLFTNQAITPLQPVLQDCACAASYAFQFLDMLLQLFIRQPAQCGIGGGAQATDSWEIQIRRRPCTTPCGLLARWGLPGRSCAISLGAFALFKRWIVGGGGSRCVEINRGKDELFLF